MSATVEDISKTTKEHIEKLIAEAARQAMPPAAGQPPRDISYRHARFPHPIEGPRYTDLFQDINRAKALTRGMIGETHPAISEAHRMASRGGERVTPQDIEYYMNPYRQNVLNRIRDESLRNFNERIMPSIESRFTKHGQHGSLQHRRESERFARDMHNDITDRQNEFLSRAYQQALDTAIGEKKRGVDVASMLPIISSMRQAAQQADIAALMGQGREDLQRDQMARDYAYQEFIRQEAHPMEKLSQLSAIIRGLPYSAAQVVYPSSQFAHNIAQQQQQHLNPAGQAIQALMQIRAANMMGGR